MKLVTTFNLPSYTFYAQLVKINKLRRVKKFELGIEGVLKSRNCFSLSEQRGAKLSIATLRRELKFRFPATSSARVFCGFLARSPIRFNINLIYCVSYTRNDH